MYITPKNLPPVEIKILMIRANVTQTAIAKKCGVSHASINKVIEGITVSDRIRRAIAEAVGVEVERIWPDPYLTGGPRKRGRPKKHKKEKFNHKHRIVNT